MLHLDFSLGTRHFLTLLVSGSSWHSRLCPRGRNGSRRRALLRGHDDAVGVGVKNKPTSQIICGSGIRTAGNTAKQLDASLRKAGLGTGTNPAA